MEKVVSGEQRSFVTGNEVVAWAALAAGADIMYGYPITPQNEIMHYWTRLAPKYERGFLQTEDELSAGFTTIGGILGGKRAFSATSGPGTVLFQEPLSMAEMMRLPMVVVVQQRGGPSTATVIYSQQEVTLTTFGGNGEGWRVVYSTSNHQDLYDYTIKAFNTAWKYRIPVIVLGDGYQAKMRESLTLYDPEVRGITMEKPQPYLGAPGIPGQDRPPIHLRNAYSVEEELAKALQPIIEDYDKYAKEIEEYSAIGMEESPEIIIIAHGIVSRAVEAALPILKEKGIKAGFFRPITLRPFAAEALKKMVSTTPNLLIVESAQGQLTRLVKAEIGGEKFTTHTLLKPGVGITMEEIVEKVVETKKGGINQ